MPALDLALGLGMIRSAAHMLHAFMFEPPGQIVRDVTRSVVAQKPRSLLYVDVVQTRGRQRLVERGRDVGGTHRGTEPPCHDVTREVVEHGREVVPAPAGDFEVGEVGLPELVDGGGLVLELVRRLDHHIGRAGDEVVRLQQPIDRSLGDKVLSLVGEPNGQLSRR